MRFEGEDIMSLLEKLFREHQGRAFRKWSGYFAIYESFLHQFVGKDILLFEIGVADGGSLQVFKKFLGPAARVVGIDIKSWTRFQEQGIQVELGNQADTGFLEKVLAKHGLPSVVIDDGSHQMVDVRATFDFLFPKLPSGGVYLVEDMHTAYRKQYGGGLKKKRSFIEFAKSHVDSLNAFWPETKLTPNLISESCRGIHFFDSVIVFEKGPLPKQELVKRGTEVLGRN